MPFTPVPDFDRPKAREVGPRHVVRDRDLVAMTGICRVCGPVALKWRSRNLAQCENVMRNFRQEQLLKWYGITLDDFERMVLERDSRCDICHEYAEFPNVDHDHKALAIRGLLCGNCNRGLGIFRDSPVLLESAIRYLGGK